ncbi:MAG: hypothetical protein ACI94O_002566 [Octadecabacter sp.]|jgi:hypothetical protein
MSYAQDDTTPTTLPVTQKQMIFARNLAMKNHVVLPLEARQDRRSLSQWIDEQVKSPAVSDNRPTSKQAAFAERIARIKRRSVPDECYRDRELMSRWINSNKL